MKSVRFILLSMPPPHKVSDRYHRRQTAINLKRVMSIRQPEKFMKKYFKENGVELHDSSFMLEHSESDNKQTFFEGDGHLNPIGTKVVANFLKDLI